MSITLFGIPNCDTVKKARQWLAQRGMEYHFHDFKKDGVSDALLAEWLRQLPWETLVNRKGTTWRALDDATKTAVVDAVAAAKLMQQSPSVIKRPVLMHNEHVHVGFSDELYQRIFLSQQ